MLQLQHSHALCWRRWGLYPILGRSLTSIRFLGCSCMAKIRKKVEGWSERQTLFPLNGNLLHRTKTQSYFLQITFQIDVVIGVDLPNKFKIRIVKFILKVNHTTLISGIIKLKFYVKDSYNEFDLLGHTDYKCLWTTG